MPQVHTLIDFCRLLQQEECRTIVMLNDDVTETQVQVHIIHFIHYPIKWFALEVAFCMKQQITQMHRLYDEKNM